MKFNKESPEPGLYLDLPSDIYHSAPGISNSGLMLIKNNPADYIWSKNAPVNVASTKSVDIGTAIHAGILEPHKFSDMVAVGPTKGRDTIKFTDFCAENQSKICLTESEYDLARLAIDSAFAHPTIKKFIDAKGHCESSIFWSDKERDILCKIRPDKDLTPSGIPLLVDVKTTSSISDWRSELTWKNPLFTMDYGHNAAFYLTGASAHYGVEYQEYCFILIQTTAEIGRYPVAIMTITRGELESLGFFDEVRRNLDAYECNLKTNAWDSHVEEFPVFRV